MARKPQAKPIDWPRCKTCKWWQQDDDDHIGPEECRPCDCPKVGEGMWLYKHETQNDLDVLAYPYDEGGCILPGPKYGCVHHKEKE